MFSSNLMFTPGLTQQLIKQNTKMNGRNLLRVGGEKGWRDFKEGKGNDDDDDSILCICTTS